MIVFVAVAAGTEAGTEVATTTAAEEVATAAAIAATAVAATTSLTSPSAATSTAGRTAPHLGPQNPAAPTTLPSLASTITPSSNLPSSAVRQSGYRKTVSSEVNSREGETRKPPPSVPLQAGPWRCPSTKQAKRSTSPSLFRRRK